MPARVNVKPQLYPRTAAPVAVGRFLLAIAAGFFGLFSSIGGSGQETDSSPNQSRLPEAASPIATDWGKIDMNRESGTALLTIDKPASTISLPVPFPNITRALSGDFPWTNETIPFSFSADASEISVALSAAHVSIPQRVLLETCERSGQFPDGRIVLGALDAEVIGKDAKVETHPGNHRIGFWTNPDDQVRWSYAATRPGKYSVWLTYSLAGRRGESASGIRIEIGDTVLEHLLSPTGSWYRYQTVAAGDLYLPEAVETPVCVACQALHGNAVMNLKSVTLVPACEGTPPCQADDGSILLHARDSTIHGSLLQWEPREAKQTIGYWTNPDDYAAWEFVVKDRFRFAVEILQGCGDGQGGSEVEFRFLDREQPALVSMLPHTVRDTGGWQAFEPIRIGKVELGPGLHRLEVRAKSKAGVAVMDLRQVFLIPDE
jgi:hypothetical protein